MVAEERLGGKAARPGLVLVPGTQGAGPTGHQEGSVRNQGKEPKKSIPRRVSKKKEGSGA